MHHIPAITCPAAFTGTNTVLASCAWIQQLALWEPLAFTYPTLAWKFPAHDQLKFWLKTKPLAFIATRSRIRFLEILEFSQVS